MARTRKQSRRNGTSGTSRKSILGKMMPPLDVRSSKDVAGLMKRIREGPLTIVLVYASWCGHCHRFMPHFDNAARTPGRSVQVAKVEDTMVDAVNEEMRRNNVKPMEVSAYPTVIAVSPNAEVVGNIEPVPETSAMVNVMKNVGKTNVIEEVAVPSVPKNSTAPSPVNVVGDMEELNTSLKNTAGNMSEEEILNIPKVVEPVSPPTGEPMGESVSPQTGGSLYNALARSASRIAPAAVLVGLAAAAMSRRRRRSTRRAGKKGAKRH